MNVENKRDDRKKKIREIAGGIKSALVLGLCLAVLACVPGGWISGKVAADLIEGPKTIRLTSVTTEELNGLSGLISHHYYLCGRGEDGKQYRLEVSAGSIGR